VQGEVNEDQSVGVSTHGSLVTGYSEIDGHESLYSIAPVWPTVCSLCGGPAQTVDV